MVDKSYPAVARMARIVNEHGVSVCASLLFLCLVILSPLSAVAAPENLDEMSVRKARHAGAAWGYSYLENPAKYYLWQPETLCYTDITTGREVWRLTNTPARLNVYHNDISVSPWSADGKRMAFLSERDTGAFNRGGENVWFIANTNGSLMRPVLNAPSRTYHHTPYLHWSPQIPDTYYEFGRNAGGATGMNGTDLYKARLTDTSSSKTLLLSFPTTQGTELKLENTLSSDGRKVIAMTWADNWVFPATIYPDASAALLLGNGYTINRGIDTSWGDTPDAYTSLHTQMYKGDGAWFFILPSSTHAWWRVKTIGSAADGGAIYSFTAPSTFGEEWPENTVTAWGGINDPFGSDYWSHGTPDKWSRHVVYSATNASPPGPGVWDVQKHLDVVVTFGGEAQHHDWNGFSDYVVSSRGAASDPNYLNDRIYVAKYNDSASRQTVVYTHTLFNTGGVYAGAGTQYASLTRPAQSPDGTKVAFHSTFLSSDDYKPDIFWAVAYYPFPPTNLSASYASGVKLQWIPPKYTERGWPFASPNPSKDPLGWPLLDTGGKEIGEPLYAREIKRYHVWRSATGTSGWQLIGSTDAIYSYTYSEDASMFMLHPVVDSLKVSASNKISFLDKNLTDGTYYYAVTSEEHSGLESNELSEILRVVVSSGAVTTTVVQAKGQKNFWTTAPPAPNPASFTISAGGPYRLTWAEPNDSKIRYYNIYYSNVSAPAVDQQHRIASVPAGTTTYLDWLADTASTGFYRITSVDRYGNQGSATRLTGPSAPGSPAVTSP